MPLTGEKKKQYTTMYMREWRKPGYERGLLSNKLNVSLDCCSNCGWEGSCDVHHLNAKDNTPSNLMVLCPNCHRDIHTRGLRECDNAVK
ncbi:hypothetical protein LCGC14_2167330 [marine sediment metagenome]|uniref:HNH domain-containing protein n=1 Tax=marine sediment metagenome TaxID=412755 RepID=A0A0F9ED94_9ZZZZ